VRALVLVALLGCGDSLTDEYGEESFTDPHGIRVAANGYAVDPVELAWHVYEVAAIWRPVVAAEGSDCNVLVPLDGLYVSWQPRPFYDSAFPGVALDGMYVPTDDAIRVGYVAPLHDSALDHEVGHAIAGHCLGRYDEASLQDLAARYGVPYKAERCRVNER
jgi:hypothetical protein